MRQGLEVLLTGWGATIVSLASVGAARALAIGIAHALQAFAVGDLQRLVRADAEVVVADAADAFRRQRNGQLGPLDHGRKMSLKRFDFPIL